MKRFLGIHEIALRRAIAHQPNHRILVFVNFGIPPNVRVYKNIIVSIVISCRNLTDYAFICEWKKLMIDSRHQCHTRSRRQINPRTGRDYTLFAIHLNLKFLASTLLRDAGPDLYSQYPPARNDIFFLFFVAMRWGSHLSLSIHELFAILRLLGQVYQNKAMFTPITQSKIGDIPPRFRG